MSNQKKIIDVSTNKIFSLELSPIPNINYDLLESLKPILTFISITWLDPVKETNLNEIPALQLCEKLIADNYGNVLLHLAAMSLDNEETTLCILNKVKSCGIKNLFIIQGDLARFSNKNKTPAFRHAFDLICFIRKHFEDYFCIAAAGYPEKHPNSANLEEDLFYLKQKVLTGVDFLITQATFDSATFEQFCINCRKNSINIPILPGLFIVNNLRSLKCIAELCKVAVTPEMFAIVEANQNNPEIIKEYGLRLATNFISDILILKKMHNIMGIHLFTLNNLKIIREVFETLEKRNVGVVWEVMEKQ